MGSQRLHAGQACHRRDHHAGEQLHGGDVAVVEGLRKRGKYFEESYRASVMTQWCDQDGACAQTAATGQVNARIALGVVAEQDLAGAHAFSRETGIGLQVDAEVGGGSAGAGTAHDLTARAQRDCRAGSPGERLSAFGDDADARLEVEVAGHELGLRLGTLIAESGPFGNPNGPEVMTARMHGHRGRRSLLGVRKRLEDSAEQLTHKLIKFRIFDEVSGLLSAERASEDARQAQQSLASAGEAVLCAVLADELAFRTKRGALQGKKMRFLRGRPTKIHRCSLPSVV